ncbi:MAG TPA: AtpZ/AtpI family protein [Kofleriaceae bacterium]
MPLTTGNSGEMSQGFSIENPHPKAVTSKLVDPAAQRSRRAFNQLSASSVGLELGVAVIVSLLFGMWLDTKAGTTPWLMLAFLVIGLVAGFRNVLRAVKRAEAAAELDDE